MSIVEQFASERKARLARLGAIKVQAPEPKPKPAPVKKRASIDPTPFYPQMWFYDLINPRRVDSRPSLLKVRRAVCEYYGMSRDEFECRRRSAEFDAIRQVAYYLAAEHTKSTYRQIGMMFGDRDHSTVIHGTKKVKRRLLTNAALAYDVAHIEESLL